MLKHCIKYGLIGGFILTILLCITVPIWRKSYDFALGEQLGYLIMFMALSMVFIGTRNYRNNNLAGYITFWTACKCSFYIALLIGVMYALSWQIYAHYFFPDFMERYKAFMLMKLKADGASANDMQNVLKEFETYSTMLSNPFLSFLEALIEILPMGLLMTLISALVLKKKQQ